MNIAKKTKIYTVALGLLVAVALVAGGCGDRGAEVPADYQTFEDSEYGIKLRYPPGWTNLGSLEDEPNSVAFFGIMAEETGESMGNLYITAERDSFEDGDTLEALTERILTNFKSVPTLEDVEALEVTLGGMEAYRTDFTLESGDGTFVSVWTVVDGVAYELDFIVKKGSYADLDETIQTVIDSFEFVSP